MPTERPLPESVAAGFVRSYSPAARGSDHVAKISKANGPSIADPDETFADNPTYTDPRNDVPPELVVDPPEGQVADPDPENSGQWVYDSLTPAELRATCENRGLSPNGSKNQMIARLLRHDKSEVSDRDADGV